MNPHLETDWAINNRFKPNKCKEEGIPVGTSWGYTAERKDLMEDKPGLDGVNRLMVYREMKMETAVKAKKLRRAHRGKVCNFNSLFGVNCWSAL